MAKNRLDSKKINNNNHIKESKTRKFVTGESRYCQSCGKESYNLFEATQANQKINQLQYCQECYNKSKSKSKKLSQ